MVVEQRPPPGLPQSEPNFSKRCPLYTLTSCLGCRSLPALCTVGSQRWLPILWLLSWGWTALVLMQAIIYQLFQVFHARFGAPHLRFNGCGRLNEMSSSIISAIDYWFRWLVLAGDSVEMWPCWRKQVSGGRLWEFEDSCHFEWTLSVSCLLFTMWALSLPPPAATPLPSWILVLWNQINYIFSEFPWSWGFNHINREVTNVGG